jgi:hypothetical protein
MYISFTSGGVYVYDGVSESTYNLLVSAPSVGRFYREHIQGKYTSTRFFGNLEPVDGAEENTSVTEADAPAVETTKFGVKWTSGVLTMEVMLDAADESDALSQFEDLLVYSVTHDGLPQEFVDDATIVEVTHYLV